MTILLLKPPQTYTQGTLMGRPCLPFGLLYLAGSLTRANHEVVIRDLLMEGEKNVITTQNKSALVDKPYLRRGSSDEEIINIVRKEKPNIIGAHCTSAAQENDAKQLSLLIKKYFPEIPLVTGGVHASFVPYKMFENSAFDFVCKGESEITIVKLLEKIKKYQTDYENIPALYFKRSGKNYSNPYVAECYKNIDNLPTPAYHLIKNLYNPLYDHSQIEPKTNKSLGIFFSRGCGRCKHCASGQAGYRHLSIKGVRKIFEYFDKHNISPKEVVVQDDDFFRDKEFTRQVMNFFKQRNIIWQAEGGIIIQYLLDGAGNIDIEYIKKLAESGIYRAYIPVETILPKSAKTMGRPYHNLDKNTIIKIFKIFKNYRVQVDTAFILGVLNESKEDILKNVNFAKELSYYTFGYIGLFAFKIFPGFEKYFQHKGFKFEILGGSPEISFDVFNIQTKELNPWELNILREKWYKEINGDKFNIHLTGYWPGRTSFKKFKSVFK